MGGGKQFILMVFSKTLKNVNCILKMYQGNHLKDTLILKSSLFTSVCRFQAELNL